MMRTILPTFILAVLLMACGGAKPVAEGGADPTGSGRNAATASDKRAETMRLFMEATQARLSGQMNKAIQLYQQCLKVDPQNHAALFELAKLYHQGGNTPQAIEQAKRATSLAKDNIWYRFLLADLYQHEGRTDDAVTVYRGLLQQWPDRYEVYFDLANTLAYTGKVNEAMKAYADMEKRFGLTEEIIMQQFGMLASNGKFAEAEALVVRAIAAHPRDASYQGLLAELYDQRGEHDKALIQYRKAIDLDPGNSMLRVALAEHFYGTGESDKAFGELEHAFHDPEMDIDAKMQLLIGFFEMSAHEGKDPGEREDLIRRSYNLIDALEKAHPESGKPHAIHGDFLLRDGDFPGALAEFRKALVHEKDRFPIWIQVLQLGLQTGDHAGMHAEAEEAISLFPTVPELYLYNGIALGQLERHEDAIEALIQGRDLVVDNQPLLAQFWSSLGDAFDKARRFPESDKAFDQALQMDPDNPNTLNNYAYYLSVRNEQLDKAERMSLRSNQLAPGQPSYQDTYAWVLFRAGKYEDAKVWVEKAIASGGHDQGVIVEHYGDILFKLGKAQAAKDQWERARMLGDTTEHLDRKINEGIWVE
jgi:tetratricopeptide (TPR) repeat protein